MKPEILVEIKKIIMKESRNDAEAIGALESIKFLILSNKLEEAKNEFE